MSVQVLILLGTVGMLLLAFAVIFMMMYHQRRVIRHQLELRDKDQQWQRESLLAAIQGQESERKRIAEDLHDEVGALLSCVKLNIGQLQKFADSADSHKALAGDTKRILDNVIEQVRAISRNLHPNTLVRFGLFAALREFCELMDRSGALRTRFQAPDQFDIPLDTHGQLLLFRVVQEVCNNIMKYAGASSVYLVAEPTDSGLRLQIDDDGTGFTQDDYDRLSRKGGSLGLKNIASRLDLIGGSISFEPLLPQGTRVLIDIAAAR